MVLSFYKTFFLCLAALCFQGSVSASVSDDLTQTSFSPHFQSWLKENNYSDLLKSRSRWSSFGGLAKRNHKLEHLPTLFIHGNSDTALGYSHEGASTLRFTGFRHYFKNFAAKGATKAELYGVSWGDASPSMAAFQTHNYENILRVRMAIEAVSEYSAKHLGNTGGKINIVSHSMGVTLALKAIQGGKAYDGHPLFLMSMQNLAQHWYFKKELIGPAGNRGDISYKVANFVAIAGASRGLDSCDGFFRISPTCSDIIGLYSGSEIIDDILNAPQPVADRIISIYSESDQILSTSNLSDREMGPSSIIPYSQETIIYPVDQNVDHFDSKDQSVELVWDLLNNQ